LKKSLVKKLWVVPLGMVAGAASWAVIANASDIKRYLRMHRM
jgi:hypothetical protein